MVRAKCHGFMGSTIRGIQESLARRELGYTQLCYESLKIIEDTKNLNSFITVCQDEALKSATRLDQQISDGGSPNPSRSPLRGIPVSIKDNFCTNQILTTCGSRMLHNFIPPYTATAVSKLLDAGCLLMGKTNMDEFAMGSSCTTSFYGPSANSWKGELLAPDKIPSESRPDQWYMAGGSSTGSAVSVASGACFASLGTDTGGSTRQPASLAGVVGFKPTYGLISRFGLIPLAHCLDVVSILARRVDDAQLVFEAVVGQDENDLTSVNHKIELVPNKTNRGVVRVGIPERFITNGDVCIDVMEQYDEIMKRLTSREGLGSDIKLELVKLDLPNAGLATECYTVISSAEIASNMSCYDGVKYGLAMPLKEGEPFDRDQFFLANRDAGFGSEVKKRILLGNYFLLSENRDKYLVQALKLRRLISDEFQRAFTENNVDVMLMPSTPTTSVSHEEWLQKQSSNKLFHEDYFLIPANLANLPAISLPSGLSRRGLPVGLQLVANKFRDLDLLEVSKLFEQRLLC